MEPWSRPAARPVRIPAATKRAANPDLACDVRPWQATGLAAKTPGSGHAGPLGSVGGGTLFAALAEYEGAPFTEEVMS